MDANEQIGKLKEFIEEPFPFVSPEEGLETISKLLLNSPALLVIENDDIIGIITKHDVMKALKS